MRNIRYLVFTLGVIVAGSVWSGTSETLFPLRNSGTDDVIDYTKYGYYLNPGENDFQYVITNEQGLADASGYGVDPDRSIYADTNYITAAQSGDISMDWWGHVSSSNPELDFYVWIDANEEPGVRQFYLGKILERAGHLHQALKAYRACMILYPNSAAWSSSGEFSWSVAEGAWNQMLNLIRKHPELGVKLEDANVTVRTDDTGLHVAVQPGQIVRLDAQQDESEVADTAEDAGDADAAASDTAAAALDQPALQIVEQRGTGQVQMVKYENGDWEMRVNDEPFFVKGVVYDPTKVGVEPWVWNWMWADDNSNGVIDVQEVWMDRNNNGNRDMSEPIVGDSGLLAEMGCNVIKTYNNKDINNALLRSMFRAHGVRVILGDFAGAYCHDSGATWEEGTDYTDAEQRKRIKDAIRERVKQVRNEPWLLAYILGNENNMPSSLFVNATRTNANKYPEEYARFLEELAVMIHELDPHHPVGVGNLMTGLVEYYRDYAPSLDFIGVNCYIGPDGFGSTFEKVKQTMDRPVLITEYGCDSYYTARGPDEEGQAEYHMGNWRDIDYNRAGGLGAGNSIGGCLFEWVDEWWKDNKMKKVDGEWVYKDPLDHQNTAPTGDMAFPDGKTQEEWLGITSQGRGCASPFLRVPKKAFYAYKKVWNSECRRKEMVPAE